MSIENEKKDMTSDEALVMDQEEKKQLVIRTVTEQCTESSEFEDIRKIAYAIRHGDQLSAKIISGGKTNYSYKLYLIGSPEIAVFTKICFDYALWNPDRSVHYDLKRVENEFLSMKQFKAMMEEENEKDAPVATPYFCVDVNSNENNNKMKILICQWSKADEQFANQFIDGHVDERVIPKLAKALAILNTTEVVDPMFNDNVRPCMRSTFGICKGLLQDIAKCHLPKDKGAEYIQKLGPEYVGNIMDKMDEHYMRREALIHSDTHVFNILVEPKPPIDNMTTEFGENGNFVLCDWEMIFIGPIGRDVGLFQSFPIACAMAYAIGGHRQIAYNLFENNIKFFDIYAQTLIDHAEKDPEFVKHVFRSSLGWIAMFVIFAYYLFDFQIDVLPIDSNIDLSNVKSSLGYIGIKLAEYGFLNIEPDLSLTELRSRYKEIIEKEMEELLKISEMNQQYNKQRHRRSSLLRISGRRVSDASVFEEAADMVRRLS